jgi:hypothetical protein
MTDRRHGYDGQELRVWRGEARVLVAIMTGMMCECDENKEVAAKVFDYRYFGQRFLLIRTQLSKVLWVFMCNYERLS